MTNRQLTLSGIDRVEDLRFTPLEKSYLKAQLIKTLLVYLTLMALTLLLLAWEAFSYRHQVTVAAECVWVALLAANLSLLPRAVAMAWKGVTEPRPPSGCEKSRPSVPRMTAPKRLTCTQPSRQER